MAVKCVPLNPDWTGSTKFDMRAIYARPNGDLTTALPLRRHASWEAKGFRYLTLADAESLTLAVPFLRSQGLNPQDFVAGVDGDGRPTPWNSAAYMADVKIKQVDADAELLERVRKYGVETVEQITGQIVPAHIKAQIEVKTKRTVTA